MCSYQHHHAEAGAVTIYNVFPLYANYRGDVEEMLKDTELYVVIIRAWVSRLPNPPPVI